MQAHGAAVPNSRSSSPGLASPTVRGRAGTPDRVLRRPLPRGDPTTSVPSAKHKRTHSRAPETFLGWADAPRTHAFQGPRVVKVTNGRRPLRISLAIGTLEVGGAETQLVGTACSLTEEGHHVEVIVLTRGGPLEAQLREAGVPVKCVGFAGWQFRNAHGRFRPWRPVQDAFRLAGVLWHLRRRRPQVLHAYLFWSYVIFIPIAWVARVPVRIAGRRGLHASIPSVPFMGALTRLSTGLSTAIVANAEAVAADAASSESVPARKLHVIPNAVDLPARVADPSVEPPVGMMIANLIHYKGHLDLVQALSLLKDVPTVRCIGEGPMRSQVEVALEAAGLGGRMLLEGRLLRARQLYADAQFALLTSHEEGMPNAILEAMAAGLPVVTTDVGGCSELVEDGVTGLLVPPRDPVALSRAIERIAQDTEFRVKAGKVARARAQSYSWPTTARSHADLYHSLLDSRA